MIPNGVPPRRADEPRAAARARLRLSDGDVALASVALFEPRKGHALLLDALARLAPERRPIVLIEGDGPGRAPLEQRAAGLERVRFVGRERNVFNLLCACDGLIETSVSGSPSPNVIAEAMGLGLAVVASVHSSAEQVRDGADGLLVDPRDAAALADALARVAGDADLRRSLGEAARASFRERFSPELAARRYGAMFEGAPDRVL